LKYRGNATVNFPYRRIIRCVGGERKLGVKRGNGSDGGLPVITGICSRILNPGNGRSSARNDHCYIHLRGARGAEWNLCSLPYNN